MKIIKPIALDDKNATVSGAVQESAPLWQALGRDYALDMFRPLISVVGESVYLLDRWSGELRKHDIQNSLTTTIGIVPLDKTAAAVSVSPNEAFISVITIQDFSPARSDVWVYQISDMSLKFTERNSFWADHPPLEWVQDSSGLAYAASLDFYDFNRGQNPRIGFVRSTDWQPLYSQATVSGASGFTAGSFSTPFYISDLTIDDSGTIYAVGGVESSFLPTNVLIKFNPVSLVEDDFSEPYDPAGEAELVYRFINYNQARSELLLNGLAATLDPLTLTRTSAQPSPSLDITASPKPRLSESGSELMLVYPNVAPNIRRLSGSNYSSLQPIDGLSAEEIEDAFYSPNFWVFAVRLGFVLIGRSTVELDEQLNPEVSQGDVYRFNNRIYESLGVNQDRPDKGAAMNPPTWLDRGFINRLRAFDGKVTSQMVGGETMSVTISPARVISGVGVFNVEARRLRVEILDDAGQVVWDSGDRSLIDAAFDGDDESDPIAQIPDYVITGFPFSAGHQLRLILSGEGSGSTKVGQIIAGTVREIGDSLFGARVGILDFSRKERDVFGDFDITERRFSNRAELPVSIRTANIAYVQRVLADVRAIPVAYVAAESQRETIIYGFFRSFDIVLDGPVWSECVIEVEGL